MLSPSLVRAQSKGSGPFPVGGLATLGRRRGGSPHQYSIYSTPGKAIKRLRGRGLFTPHS